VRIFLSHASEQTEIAEAVAIALNGEGHVVFFDRSSLPSGHGYNDRIRDAIAGSDVFVFLISPEAVSKGRYTITELEFAKQQWSNPSNHVLPVVVRQTEVTSIPVYLRAVTLLEPQGNIPAAVAAAVGRIANPRWRRLVRQWAPLLLLVGLIGAGFLARWAVQQRRLGAEVASLVESGRLGHETRNYAAAWESYDRAASLAPRNLDVESAQERLALEWLESIRVTQGQGTFTAIVQKVEPVIVRCASRRQEPRRAADCLAHLGWGDFLRRREGAGGLDPIQHYRRALEVDRDNVYGHAMWGFELLRTRGLGAEAKDHFERALASGREHGYVRSLQLSGLLWRRDAQGENEVIRIANEMRVRGERFSGEGPATVRFDVGRLWDIYYDRMFNENDLLSFLGALPPPDHLATFQWLFGDPESAADKRELKLFVLATLQEQADQPAEALASLLGLRETLARNGALASGGRLADRTMAAVKRLSKK
jgi:tetratricopeptide (TPR) repeat protein